MRRWRICCLDIVRQVAPAVLWTSAATYCKSMRAYGMTILLCCCSAGMLLMQLAVPELRYGPVQRSFNSDLAACNFDLNDWRCALSVGLQSALASCLLSCKRTSCAMSTMSGGSWQDHD